MHLDPLVLPIVGIGRTIALTATIKRGDRVCLYTSVPFTSAEFSLLERVNWLYFADLIRAMDNQFVTVAAEADADPYNGGLTKVRPLQAVFVHTPSSCGNQTTRASDADNFGLRTIEFHLCAHGDRRCVCVSSHRLSVPDDRT